MKPDPNDTRNWNWFCRLTGWHRWCLDEGFYIVNEPALQKCNRRNCKAERSIIFHIERS